MLAMPNISESCTNRVCRRCPGIYGKSPEGKSGKQTIQGKRVQRPGWIQVQCEHMCHREDSEGALSRS